MRTAIAGQDENGQLCYVYYQMCPNEKCKRPIVGYKSGSISCNGEGVTLTKPFKSRLMDKSFAKNK